MQPLKITAVMQDGRIAGTEPWFPLDSILASVWIKRNYPELAYLPITDTNKIIEAQLPFERRGSGDDWYWACSFNTVPPLHEYVMHWHKRFDDHLEQYIDFGGKRGKVDIKSSKFKAYRMPLVVQLFDRLVWYAVGDLDAVRALCNKVTHLGKKSAQGLGCVDYWTMEPWPEDWGEVARGKVTRALPIELGMPAGVGAANVQLHSIRPPYWHTGNQRVCYMPEVARG